MSWKSYENAAEKGPWSFLVSITLLMAAVVALVSVLGYGMSWFGEAGQVTKDEFGPKALLRKYEWFKNTAAALQSRQASIQVYEGRLKRLSEAYAGKDRGQWPREDREQANLWEQEVSGLISSFNLLAAEYNSNMSKEHYRFCNAGDLPAGATQPLNREFQQYLTK